MINASIVMFFFISFLVLKNILEFYLEYRNFNHIKAHQNEIPPGFDEKISLEEHKKAASYSMEKIKTGVIFHTVALVILVIWTLGGGLNYLARIVEQYSGSDIVRGVLFFTFFGMITLLIGIPESAYKTFVLEEKFGFNKTTVRTFIMDLFKGLVIGAIIGIPLLALILWIMRAMGTYWWLYAWGILTLFQLLMLIIYPMFIAPLFNKFSPMEEGPMKEKIVALLKRCEFSFKDLFVMDASKRSSHGNAYFTGFGKYKRIVFFDTLLKNIDENEVEAILAHELGHYKKRHVFKYVILSITSSLIGFYILGFLMNWIPFYEGHGVNVKATYTALMLFTMVSSNYTFFLTPFFSWFSRKHEFEADKYACDYSDGRALVSGLVKLYKDNASTLTPDPLYSFVYHSHPVAVERIEHIKRHV